MNPLRKPFAATRMAYRATNAKPDTYGYLLAVNIHGLGKIGHEQPCPFGKLTVGLCNEKMVDLLNKEVV